MNDFTSTGSPARLTFIAAAGDDQSLPRFAMVGYSGGPMRLEGHDIPVIVDLETATIAHPSDCPILYEHDCERTIGHATGDITSEGIVLAGVFSGVGADRDKVVLSGKRGYPWQASIGGRAAKYEIVPAGETAYVNGRVYEGPFKIARGVVVREVSVVSLGADPNTSTSVAASMKASAMGFEQWVESMGFDLDQLTVTQRDALRQEWDAKQMANMTDADNNEKPDGDEAKASFAGLDIRGGDGASLDSGILKARRKVSDDMRRIAAIRELAVRRPQHQEIAARGIDEGWSKEKVELEMIRAGQPKGLPMAPGGYEPDTNEVLLASLCTAAGIPEDITAKGISEKSMDLSTGLKHRNIGLWGLIHAQMAAVGKPLPPGQRIGDAEIRAAFTAARDIQAAGTYTGGYSTVSLPNILSNLVNKSLLTSFTAVNTVADKICAPRTVDNFKAWNELRITVGSTLDQVAPTGELHHGTLIEENIGGTPLGTYGEVLSLGRQMLINDDLGAFNNIPVLFGRKAALTREKAFFTLLLANSATSYDSVAYFHSTHANLSSGPLAIAGLTTAQALFRNQTDKAGDPILLEPRYVLVGPTNEAPLDALMASIQTVATGLASTSAAQQSPDGNPFAGKYEKLISPYIENANLTNHSTTRWFMFADPIQCPAFFLANLRGVTTPVVESTDMNFNTLGIAFRVYFDFSVAQGDYRGAVMSPGT